MEISPQQLSALSDYFVRAQDEILAFTRALVEIESPSGDETGSNSVVSLLSKAVADVRSVSNIKSIENRNYGAHFRLHAFAGTSDVKPVVIVGHTDTVHPRGSLAQRPWRIAEGKAFGPGVFDMKANCALAIEIIRTLSTNGMEPKRAVVLLLTCDEETGSADGRALVEAAARNAHAVLVLEPPAIGGRAKTGRKGTGMFSIEVRGRAAHAGLEPEKGASAILELARQTDKLHSLNGSLGGVTVNVGVFQGGTLSNVVAAQARAEVDIRFCTSEEGKRIESEILNLRPFDERVELVVTGGINRPPLERSDKTVALYEHARAIAAQLGFELGETQVGGASDGNFAAAAGATVLDGLGISGDGAHAVHEHIVIADIPRRGALLAGLIASL